MTPEAWIHVIQLVGTLFAIIVSLKIRLEQARVKEELKDDFNQKHNENKEIVVEHIAKDEEIFKKFDERFDDFKDDLKEIKQLIRK